MSLDNPYIEVPRKEYPCICVPFVVIRNWFNYTMNPIDLNIW